MKCVWSSCLFKKCPLHMKLNLVFCEVFCLKKFAITNDTKSLRCIKFCKMITCHFVELCSLRWEALGWFLFYAGNVAAAFGSAYYHLKPWWPLNMGQVAGIWILLSCCHLLIFCLLIPRRFQMFFYYNIGVSSWILFECIRVFWNWCLRKCIVWNLCKSVTIC